MRQSPLLGTLQVGADHAEPPRRQNGVVQGNTPPSTSGKIIRAQAGNTGRRSSAPAGDAADAKFAASNLLTIRQDRPRVHSAPTSDHGGIGYALQGGGDVIRFGVEQEIVPRLSSASRPGPSPWPSSSAAQFSSEEGSPPLQQQASNTSTLSGPSRRTSGSGSRSALAALRAEREAAEAEARQAMVRAAPNLFPEILVASPTAGEAGGGADGMRGRRGWVAGA